MPVWGKYYTVRYHCKCLEICSGWSISTKKVSKGYRPELLSTSTLRATCGTLAHRPPVPLEGPGWHQNLLCI